MTVASERLYYDDAYTTRFEARIVAHGHYAGRSALELAATYFYPESGGQEADRGRLGGAEVLDVQADDEGRVWHVVEAPEALAGDALEAHVDWPRRFDHMQQHTGQHVLSAGLEQVLEAPTLSSHLGTERSTIEVALADVDWRAIERLEEAANRVVWEDRPVVRHWVDESELSRFRLRKPAQVQGRIRVVEIPDWDQSACGGTHTNRTGEVGVIKVVRWEKVRGNLRLEFLCGARALRDHAWRTEALVEAARKRTLKDRDLIAHLERALAERDELQKRAADLAERLLLAEARERVGDPPRGAIHFAAARSRDEVRRFTLKCLEVGAPWVVAGAGSPEPVIVVGRAKAGGRDLRALVPGLLERARGKGGGSPDLVQASAADSQAAEAACRWVAGELGSGAE
ncbi:MAG TPA: alanyl-tRNA editing protein [Candidatus Limnocylindria bacterium]|nr:alanyl-tRNA editing protein [Candidatus Limnocylindria bacterium]